MKKLAAKVVVCTMYLMMMSSAALAMNQSPTNFSHIKLGYANYWANYLPQQTNYTTDQVNSIITWQSHHLDIGIGGPSLAVFGGNGVGSSYWDASLVYSQQTYLVDNIVASHGWGDPEGVYAHMSVDFTVPVNNPSIGVQAQYWQGMDRFDNAEYSNNGVPVNGVFTLNGSSYTDVTIPIYDGSSPQTVSDKLLVGYFKPFADINFTFTTPSGKTVTAQYWNGTAWAALTATDGTSGWTQNGLFTFTPPSNWAKTAINGSRSKWWVRFTVSGSGTTPVISTIRGDDWLTGTDHTGCRGWNATDSHIVGTGELAYNPTPPAGASAKFRYQARATGMWAPNAMFGNVSNIQSGVRTWYVVLAEMALQLNDGHMYHMFDDVGAYPTITSPSGFEAYTDINHTDGWGASIVSGMQGTTIPLMKATYPNMFAGANTRIDAIAKLFDWSLNETFISVSDSINTGRYDVVTTGGEDNTSFDGYLSYPGNTGNPLNSNGIMIYIDTEYGGTLRDPSGTPYPWDKSDRSPMLGLAAYYMGANENTYYGYNLGGTSYQYYGSPGTYYYWSGTATSGTLSVAVPTGLAYQIYGNFTNFPEYPQFIRIGNGSTSDVIYGAHKVDNGHITFNYSLILNDHPIGDSVQYSITDNFGVHTSTSDSLYFQQNPLPDGSEIMQYGMWYPAMAANVGTPVETRSTWNGIWKRDYTNARILMRQTWYGQDANYLNTFNNYDLGGTYYRLKASGTTGPAITSVSLRGGEGAVLLKAPVTAAALPASKPSAPKTLRRVLP
jgi:hypothetical protein